MTLIPRHSAQIQFICHQQKVVHVQQIEIYAMDLQCLLLNEVLSVNVMNG